MSFLYIFIVCRDFKQGSEKFEENRGANPWQNINANPDRLKAFPKESRGEWELTA